MNEWIKSRTEYYQERRSRAWQTGEWAYYRVLGEVLAELRRMA